MPRSGRPRCQRIGHSRGGELATSAQVGGLEFCPSCLPTIYGGMSSLLPEVFTFTSFQSTDKQHTLGHPRTHTRSLSPSLDLARPPPHSLPHIGTRNVTKRGHPGDRRQGPAHGSARRSTPAHVYFADLLYPRHPPPHDRPQVGRRSPTTDKRTAKTTRDIPARVTPAHTTVTPCGVSAVHAPTARRKSP